MSQPPQQPFYPQHQPPQQPFPPQQPYRPQYQPLQQTFPPPKQQFPPLQQPSRQAQREQAKVQLFNALFILGVIFLCAVIANGGSIVTSISNTLTAFHSPYAVGDTITVDGTACTMTSIKVVDTLVIIAHVEIVNNSGNEISYSYTDFHLETDNGQIINSYDSNLTPGSLAPNGKVAGDVAFEAPQLIKGAILWQPGLSQSLSYKWQFDTTHVTSVSYPGYISPSVVLTT